MKMTAKKAAEAKEMNAKYFAFEIYSYDDGKSVYYKTFGRAYKAANNRAGKGDNVALFGLALNSFNYRQMLYCC